MSSFSFQNSKGEHAQKILQHDVPRAVVRWAQSKGISVDSCLWYRFKPSAMTGATVHGTLVVPAPETLTALPAPPFPLDLNFIPDGRGRYIVGHTSERPSGSPEAVVYYLYMYSPERMVRSWETSKQ